MSEKILQITAANDWYAKYEEDGATFFEPLACWALVEADGKTMLAGMVPVDGTLCRCKDTDGFVDFVHRVKIAEMELLMK